MCTHKDYQLGPFFGWGPTVWFHQCEKYLSQNLDLKLVQDVHIQKYWFMKPNIAKWRFMILKLFFSPFMDLQKVL